MDVLDIDKESREVGEANPNERTISDRFRTPHPQIPTQILFLFLFLRAASHHKCIDLSQSFQTFSVYNCSTTSFRIPRRNDVCRRRSAHGRYRTARAWKIWTSLLLWIRTTTTRVRNSTFASMTCETSSSSPLLSKCQNFGS